MGEYEIYEVKGDYGRISTVSSEWICVNAEYVTRVETPKSTQLSFKQRLERIEKILGIGA